MSQELNSRSLMSVLLNLVCHGGQVCPRHEMHCNPTCPIIKLPDATSQVVNFNEVGHRSLLGWSLATVAPCRAWLSISLHASLPPLADTSNLCSLCPTAGGVMTEATKLSQHVRSSLTRCTYFSLVLAKVSHSRPARTKLRHRIDIDGHENCLPITYTEHAVVSQQSLIVANQPYNLTPLINWNY